MGEATVSRKIPRDFLFHFFPRMGLKKKWKSYIWHYQFPERNHLTAAKRSETAEGYCLFFIIFALSVPSSILPVPMFPGIAVHFWGARLDVFSGKEVKNVSPKGRRQRLRNRDEKRREGERKRWAILGASFLNISNLFFGNALHSDKNGVHIKEA